MLLLALAALKALLPVLLVTLLLALAYSLITQPRETLAFVALSALGSVASARPGIAIGAFVLVWMATLAISRKPDTVGQSLLPDACEHHSN